MSSAAKPVFELSPKRRALLDKLMHQSQPGRGAAARIPRRPAEDRRPLSFAQQRLWFIDQLNPGSPFYNMHLAVRLTGPLRQAALARGLNAVVARHESLRTTFTALDGALVQVVAALQTVPLPVIDLTGLPADRREACAQALALEAAQQPFDLARGPLFTAWLLRLAADHHVLLLTMHHIISDAWSMGVLVRDLAALYESFVQGRPAALPELPIQYSDFACWQKDWLAEEGVLEAQLAYWTQQLRGPLPVLSLPIARPRPAAPSFWGARQAVALSPALTRGLHDFCRRENVTLFMVLLAAYQVLLHRYSGQADLIVGAPIANRVRVEIENLVGFFVNMLALRVDLSGDPPFREFVQRVRSTVLDAYANEDLPFDRLVEELQPERKLSHAPLFQVLFGLQNAPMPRLAVSDLALTPMPVDKGVSKFDLHLTLFDAPDAIQGFFEYNLDLFEVEAIARLSAHFVALLEGLVARPDQRLSRLPLLTPAECHQLLAVWAQADTPPGANIIFAHPLPDVGGDRGRAGAMEVRPPGPAGSPGCLHELFEAQAARSPHALALVFEEAHLTYEALDARANQVAHYLREQGVGPDTPVAICVERSLEMVVGVLGILKAGGAYVPLDPTYPPDRLAFMLADCHTRVLLTQARLAPTWAGLPASLRSRLKVVTLESDWPVIAQQPADRRSAGTTPEHLAYVIYTSGSTGEPKGVLIEHRGVVNYLDWCRQAYPLDQGQGAPVHSSLAFDLTVTSLFAPLLEGRRVVLLPDLPGAGRLADCLRQESEFSLVKLTPAHLQVLSEQLPAFEAAGRTRAFIIGGEILTDDHIRFWQSFAPATVLVNEYGPTETVVGCCAYRVPPGQTRTGVLPIGRPIQNTRLYVLDSHLQPVPIGVPGELYIGGAGVARGYVNRPDLTAESFVPDPFTPTPTHPGPRGEAGAGLPSSEGPPFVTRSVPMEEGSGEGLGGARLYKTGDRARFLPDGNLECLGRTDQQVKLRGFRIELGEVEAALLQHPAIEASIVQVRENERGERHLVAYVLSQSRPGPDPDELWAFIQKRLPGYMAPSAYVTVDCWPLTPNGKIDRAALPDPDWRSAARRREYVAPRNALEAFLARQWGEVLGLEQVGVYDNFFELGGHSLITVRLITRIQEVLPIRLEPDVIFDAPTIAQLAAVIETHTPQAGLQLAQAGGPLEPPIARRGPAEPAPLTFAQQQLWFIQQLDPTNAAYNVRAAVRLTGPLNVAALAASFDEIVSRHEILRTSFPGLVYPAQVIAAASHVALPVIDLQAIEDGARDAHAHALANAEAQWHFDLASGPLIRASLLRLGERQHVFLLGAHHIVCDAESIPIFVRELSLLYAARTQGRSAALPDLPIQFADFAAWQAARLQGEALERQLAYWKQQLDGAPAVLTLPLDRPRPPIQAFRGAAQPFSLSAELTQKIKALGQRESASLSMTLLAAFQVLLDRYSGQEDIVVSISASNRQRRELEPLIGPFFNILLIRARLAGDPTFLSVLRQVRRLCLEAYEHQELPFSRLVEALQPERSLSYHPLSQVMFVLDNTPETPLDLPGVSVQSFGIEKVTAQYDLLLRIRERDGQLWGQLEYSTDLFEASTIQRMLGCLQALLEGVVTQAGQRISALPILTEAARRELLTGWPVRLLPDPCTAEAFEAQVAQRGSAIAAVCEGESISYSELNRRANRLARQLLRHPIGPEVCVGVLADRGLDFLTALLAIFKAGGVYLPLDPAHPPKRLSQVLELSRCPLVLTTAALAPQLAQACAHLPSTTAPRHGLIADLWQQPDTDADNPTPRCHPASLAYVMYTSGSTGEPKGAMVEHAGMLNHILAKCRDLQLTSSDRVAQTGPQCFDISVWQFLAPLLVGGQVHILPDEAVRDPGRLLDEVEHHHLSVLQVVPSMLHALVREIEHRESDRPRLQALRWVIPTGDALPGHLCQEWFALYPHIPLLNNYGSTECSDDHCHFPITRLPDRDEGLPIMPIGRPIPNSQAWVLNRHGALVPPGGLGEFFTGGLVLGRGYLNRPDLTAEKFRPHPFSPLPGARVYQTGDAVRARPDGSLEFVGRLDARLKLHGLRIEPGEIVAALRRHPAIDQAVVLVRHDPPAAPRLVAYLVARQSPVPTTAGLQGFLKETLPAYLVPSTYIWLAALPLTPNGKLDRQALPPPDASQLAEDFSAPQTDRQQRLADLWAAALGLDKVGITQNFFDLGGDSFKAIQVVRQFGEGLTLLDLFKHPTIQELEAQLSRPDPEADQFLHRLTAPVSQPDLTLVCVPYGGGSAIVYRPLAQALPPEVALYAVALPGHDLHREGEAFQPIDAAARACVAELKTRVRGRLALYGHCAGVALTLEIARQLQASGRDLEAVYLGGVLPGTCRSRWVRRILTQMLGPRRQGTPLDSAALLAQLRWLGGFNEIQDPAELEFVLKAYEYDGQTAGDYLQKSVEAGLAPRLQAPLVCLVGDQDPLTPHYQKRFREWQTFAESVKLIVISGGDHYFVKHKAAEVARCIVEGQLKQTPRP